VGSKKQEMQSRQNEFILALQLRKESGQKELEIGHGFRISPFHTPDLFTKTDPG